MQDDVYDMYMYMCTCTCVFAIVQGYVCVDAIFFILIWPNSIL